MQFKATFWLDEGRRLAGTIHSSVPVPCVAWWTPTTEDTDVDTAQRVERSAGLVRTYPDSRLAKPLGIVRGDLGVATLVGRPRTPPLRALAPLPEGLVCRIVASLLDLVATWPPLQRPGLGVRIGVDQLHAGVLAVGPDGTIGLSRVDDLVGTDDADPLTAIGLLLHELLVGAANARPVTRALDDASDESAYTAALEHAASFLAERSSAHTAQLFTDLLAPDPDKRPPIAKLHEQALERAARGARLLELAQQLARTPPRRSGPKHPWAGQRLPVRRLVVLDDTDAPDPTDGTHAPVPASTDSRAIAEVDQGGLPAERRFDLVKRLATGGMGHVFIAKDPALRREIALKVLRKDSAESRTMVDRFVREVQITAQLEHPNIVPVYSSERTLRGMPAFSMKLIGGITFLAYLREARTLAEADSLDETHALDTRLEHFLKVCDAVAFAHSRGVIHRDLKPSNLMLGGFNDVDVMDWGVAKVSGERDDFDDETGSFEVDEAAVGSTRIGEAVGTVRYMSPEQARGENDQLTGASDQFTLGLILYEIVSLQRARDRKPSREALRSARKAWDVELRDLDGELLDPGLSAIIRKATALTPAERYVDVTAFADDVRRFLHGRELRAMPDGPIGRVWRRMQQHPALVMATVLTLVILVALFSTVSLSLSLTATARAAKQVERMTALAGRVSQQSRRLDGQLQEYEELLEGLRVATLRLLEDHPAERARFRRPTDLSPSQPDVHPLDRYGQLVTFNAPIAVWAPTADTTLAARQEGALQPLAYHLQQIVLRSAGPDVRDLRYLREPGAPVMWALAGFESGLLVDYPGHAKLRTGYDPRTRPWYRRAEERGATTWGSPHPDSAGTGLLLAASTPLFDEGGRFLGVAGIELALDEVIDQMTALEQPGLRASYLLEDDGDILVDSARDADEAHEDGDYAELAHVPIGSEALRARLLDGDPSGFVFDGDALYVYDQMTTLDWYYVVEVDASEVDPRR